MIVLKLPPHRAAWPEFEYDTTSAGARDQSYPVQQTQSDELSELRVSQPQRPSRWSRLWALCVMAAPGHLTAHPNPDSGRFGEIMTVALTSTLPLSLRLVDHDIEPALWRGTFSLHQAYETLFTKQLELRTADLQSWRPRFTPPRRIFEDEDA